LEGLPNGKEYMDLWKEYEDGESEEARVFKDIDKLEMAMQALEYQDAYPDLDLSEFLFAGDEQINIPEIRALYREMKMK
jgi:putative hydrolase of HD superfamily